MVIQVPVRPSGRLRLAMSEHAMQQGYSGDKFEHYIDTSFEFFRTYLFEFLYNLYSTTYGHQQIISIEKLSHESLSPSFSSINKALITQSVRETLCNVPGPVSSAIVFANVTSVSELPNISMLLRAQILSSGHEDKSTPRQLIQDRLNEGRLGDYLLVNGNSSSIYIDPDVSRYTDPIPEYLLNSDTQRMIDSTINTISPHEQNQFSWNQCRHKLYAFQADLILCSASLCGL
ncbi:unnamed protein product [Protopolystoma xenopodis]|uniref:Uncharacterized protein n=1 Tax=Protopolystoma xenopodis TaxID=117903 RepID=A0A3S5B3E4_9PLAT|nr:unnamed protein product [Protopolystoma xenopodis]